MPPVSLACPAHRYSVPDHKSHKGEKWITSRRKIAWHYLTSVWFPVDLVSIAVSAFDIFADANGPLARFKSLRVLRVLRLLKFVNLLRRSTIVKRWELHISINYAALSISVLLLGLFYMCHVFACVWGLQASFDPISSWMGPDGQGYCVDWDPTTTCPPGQKCDVRDPSVLYPQTGYSCMGTETLYTRAIYWAVTTVTSTGYGDVSANKQKPEEQIVCLTLMYCGALFFAYIIGSFCGVASTLSPDMAGFRVDITDLNWHMENEKIPPELRYRLREYVHQTMKLRQQTTRIRLMQLFSPGLAGEFALKMNERWLEGLWWLQGINGQTDRELHVRLALELRAHVYPTDETVPLGSLYVVSARGRALYAGRVLGLGAAFRTDEILDIPGLRAAFPAIALSYLWTYAIRGERLRQLINDCPRRIRMVIKKHTMNLCLRRSIVRAAEEDCARRGVKFHGRSHYIYARNDYDNPKGVVASLASEFMDRPQRGAGAEDDGSLVSQAVRRSWSPTTGSGRSPGAAPDTGASISGEATLMAMQRAIERLADEQVREPSERAI